MNLGRKFELHDFHIGWREDTEYSLWPDLDVNNGILIGTKAVEMAAHSQQRPGYIRQTFDDNMTDIVLGRAATIPSSQD